MSSSVPKCSGWRFKGKTKCFQRVDATCRYYLSLTCRKYYKPYASLACKRDKRILEKRVEPLRSDVPFEKTVLQCLYFVMLDLLGISAERLAFLRNSAVFCEHLLQAVSHPICASVARGAALIKRQCCVERSEPRVLRSYGCG